MGMKGAWEGEILSVQPRIRLTRSFDQLSHSHLGDALRVRGTMGGEAREFVVASGRPVTRSTDSGWATGCPSYKAVPNWKVPGRKGMFWEEDCVDEDATAHRGPDD
jgi:hypothetical protein